MRRFLGIVLVAAALAAALAWPRINDVETGRTPEYPDLQVRTYARDTVSVARAAQKVVERLPRWTFVGAGQGPGGAEVKAVHKTAVFRFSDDVTVRVKGAGGGRSTVSVRSKSRVGKWDFGQNARNIRELLAELDSELR
jgi:uncharacterized protein (DUF1499 family)